MAHIIAGHFQEQSEVEKVVAALSELGIGQDRISSFYLNPAGQHNLYGIGGDREESPGVHDSVAGVVRGATTGGAIGAAAGLTGAPMFGPVGPAVGALVGAHIGGLIGSLSHLTEDDTPGQGATGAPAQPSEARQRKSGLMVAVSLEDAFDDSTGGNADENADDWLRERRQEIIGVMDRFGVQDLEEADGTIGGGDWQDFDPLAAPRPILP
jgi:hypothetical protein